MTLREALDVFEMAARAELIKRLDPPPTNLSDAVSKIDQGLAEGRKAALPIIRSVAPDAAVAWERAQDRDLRRGRAETEQLRAEVADLKCSVIAFGAPAMVEYARDMGLPKGHLYPSHYDILKQAGARMDSFTRAEVETHGR